MLRRDVELASGLVRFYSKDQVMAYVENMIEYYKAKHEEYGQQMGGLLRGPAPQPSGGKEGKKETKEGREAAKVLGRGWVKVGTLPVNTGDSVRAMGEVTLKIVDEYKARVEKTSEALKSLSDLQSINVSDASAFTLFINRGVPEALIVADAA